MLSVWALPLAKLSAAVASRDQQRAKRPCPCGTKHVGSVSASSSSEDTASGCSWLSAPPTGTGCAYIGDGSRVPAMLESASDSLGLICGGGSLAPQRSVHRGLPRTAPVRSRGPLMHGPFPSTASRAFSDCSHISFPFGRRPPLDRGCLLLSPCLCGSPSHFSAL